MMELGEAIKHCEKVALSCSNDEKKCALEHVQLMQWLKELRVLRQLVNPKYLQEIRGLQKTWGKEWEDYFNRALCYDISGPFAGLFYEWKPSDEQIEALEHFVRSICESGFASYYDNNTKLLYSLLEQLKKL